MTALLLVVMSIFVFFSIFVGVSVTAVWLTVRRIRRSRMVTRGAMLVRWAAAPHSAAREVGRLRIVLYDSMVATGRVLLGVPAPRLLTDLAKDLQRAAWATDRRLALLASEPEQALLAQLLPPLRLAVANLTRSAAEVRATAWQFAGGLDDLQCSALAVEVADQITGLRAGLAEVEAIRASVLGPRPARSPWLAGSWQQAAAQQAAWQQTAWQQPAAQQAAWQQMAWRASRRQLRGPSPLWRRGW